MTKDGAPIGVFDSGYGGLTVLKELQKKLPKYDFIYIGDNARTPYGTRSFETVYQYTLQAVKTFFDLGCELVIIACNTASAKALRSIQQNDLPSIAPNKRVLGVIRPSTEAIGEITKTKHVGVFATPGTVQSESYVIEIKKFHPEIEVKQEACPLWVPLIENDQFDNEGGRYFIKYHIDHLLSQDEEIDTVILGCTHYPILKPLIEEFIPTNVNVLSQGSIVANSLENYLERHPEIEKMCSKNGKSQYFTTEDPRDFSSKATLFLGYEIQANKIILSN
ncbi:glutamate racemase [Parvicella tangerina]|uniref:Glutamate racemase n=1 Tax=Parvicella tangerina TaxID=2829795 RepID=A0A916JM27_9FLAO|nr:glutamate racemase [Parvicella tangerina]CAG5081063.1 Glutamate racemase 1 [Parvicella tangerina]